MLKTKEEIISENLAYLAAQATYAWDYAVYSMTDESWLAAYQTAAEIKICTKRPISLFSKIVKFLFAF